MKILLSPAKMMSLETQGNWHKKTTPQFASQSQVVMNHLKELTSEELQKLMKISQELAELNIERNHNWQVKTSAKNGLQAALAFKGEVYRGLSAETMDEAAQTYLNQNLFILSGLYGILRPSDQIMLYRLEMGSRLAVESHKNLYGFWKENLTDYVNSQLKKEEVLLNLASVEYAKVLDDKKLKSPKIEVDFMDFKNGALKKIMVYFKQARGTMARYCAENNVQTLEEVKLFNEEGYAFDDKLSSDHHLVFVR